VSNNHYYTPIDLQNIFLYMFSKIDFTVEGLTTDTGCSISFYPEKETGTFDEPEFDFYEQFEKMFISDVLLKIKQGDFENTYNSHDWIKIYKHVFQHTELINFQSSNIMQSWHYFSTYFRDAGKNVLIGPDEYNLQLKHLISRLIFNNAELEAKCIHEFLLMASKIYSNDSTIIDSKKVANMLGGVFYSALKIEGIHRSFKLIELDKTQQISYVNNVQKVSKVLSYIIEDPFFHQEFNKHNYADFLIVGKITPDSPEENPRVKFSLDKEKLPDSAFIKSFKLKSSHGDDTGKILSIEDFKALRISEKRSSQSEYLFQEESNLKVSFSEECLLKRSPNIELYVDPILKSEMHGEVEKTANFDIKKKYLSYSRSLDEKTSKLEKKLTAYRKSDGDKSSNAEIKNEKILSFSSGATTSNSVSPDCEKRKLFSSQETSPSPEVERKKVGLNKEDDLSPEIRRRRLSSSKEMSPGAEPGTRKKRLNKDKSLSPVNERRKVRSSRDVTPSPETERRKPRLSIETSLSPEIERRELTFSQGMSGIHAGEIPPETKKERSVKNVLFK
jgi:hypothetical protein